MSYLQNSIAPTWNIYFYFVTKGRLVLQGFGPDLHKYTYGITQSSFRASGSRKETKAETKPTETRHRKGMQARKETKGKQGKNR
jgi:hypothetical protein